MNSSLLCGLARQIRSLIAATCAGFPRIGRERQLKKALERCACCWWPCLSRSGSADTTLAVCSYWKGGIALKELVAVSAAVDEAAWKLQASAGAPPADLALHLRPGPAP